MDQLWAKIADWLKDILIDGIMSNLSGMFDSTNQKIGEIAGNVGTTPQAWNGGVFSMIQNLSETVIVPIAGLILAFVMTLELIQLITEKNNLHDLDNQPERRKPKTGLHGRIETYERESGIGDADDG